MSFDRAVLAAMEAARAAGDILRSDFHRPDGPRGAVDKAVADTEAEKVIANRLRAAFPKFGFLGEETGRIEGESGQPVWVVDPNDGTRDYLKGRRGSAVSIALVFEGRPVLGVVHPFAYPDSGGSMYHAVEGVEGVFRNGSPSRPAWRETLGAADVVLVSGGGDRGPAGNLACSSPARYRAIPSIAHRLALVATGSGTVATSLYRPQAWDYAAGHMLIRAAGGALVDENGREPVYGANASGHANRLFASSRAVALAVSGRDWDKAFRGARDESVPVQRPARGRSVLDPGLLSRAHGALLGALVGDALGGVWERRGPLAGAAAGGGLRRVWDAAPEVVGRLSDDGEMTLSLARSLAAPPRPDVGHDAEAGILFDPDRVWNSYREWGTSGPETGATIRAALAGRPNAESLANGALMRVSPLGLWRVAVPEAPSEASDDAADHAARRDTALTHPNPACADASAMYVRFLRQIVRGHAPSVAWDRTHAVARKGGVDPRALNAFVAARSGPAPAPAQSPGLVWIALQTAVHEALATSSYEETMERVIDAGGDVDTNATIAGALVGAVLGREAIPQAFRDMVLSYRATAESRYARPARYWAHDAMDLAERLAGGEGTVREREPTPA